MKIVDIATGLHNIRCAVNMHERANMHTIALTSSELEMGAACGVSRNVSSIIAGRKNAHGKSEDTPNWNIHIEGALGEIAVARYLNIFWSPTVNTFRAPDLGKNLQVRTRSSHDYDLIVRPTDSDTDLFVLVTGIAPIYTIWGYIQGQDAKKEELVKDYGSRPKAFFVPKKLLIPIEILMDILKVKK